MQWVIDAKSIVDRGYYEHRDTTGAFQIPTLSGNHVFICSNELIDEFRNAPDDVLSFGYRTADVSLEYHGCCTWLSLPDKILIVD